MHGRDTSRTLLADGRVLERLMTGESSNLRRRFAGWLTALLFSDLLLMYGLIAALEKQRLAEGYTREALLYGLAAVVYIHVSRRIYGEANRQVTTQTAAWGRDLIARMFRLPLVRFESIGRPSLMTRLTGDIHRVMSAAPSLVDTARVATQLVLNSVYLAFLSSSAALVTLLIAVAMSAVLLDQHRSLSATHAKVADGEVQIYAMLDGIVRGAGPIKQHAGRDRAIGEAAARLADEIQRLRTHGYDRFYSRQHGVAALLYGLLGINVFLLPLLLPIDAVAVRLVDFVIVWLFFRIVSLAFVLPELAQVAGAIRRLTDLERALDDSSLEPAGSGETALNGAFEALTVSGLEFRYPSTDDRTGCCVGPIDATFRRGEIVFLTGQNGSGKSTFLKMLTGLYVCEAGQLQIDGQPIDAGSLGRWRSLFATIFTDHHLFARAHGIAPAALETQGARLLAEMQLSHKTGFEGDRIVDRSLSTGQSKRLALVLARLSDRPVLVLDEWAAGQDPEFRAIFYHEILPALRALGKLVIAVTHDDQYFGVADRTLQFLEGRLVETTSEGASP